MERRKLYDGISSNSISRMTLCFKPVWKHYRRGEIIMTYDTEAPDSILVMEEGRARLDLIDEDGDLMLLETYGPGDIFGTMFTLPLESFEYTVTAEENCTVEVIDFHHVVTPCSKACPHHSKFISNLFIMTAQRSQELSLHLSLLQGSTRTRLLTYLKYLQGQHPDDETVTIPMSLTDLAEYLHVDRSAMMREIRRMNDDGTIESRQRTFRILDRDEA